MRAVAERAVEYVIGKISTLAEQPAYDLDGAAELAASLIEPLPELGAPFDELLATVDDSRRQVLQHGRTRLLGLHPGRRSLSGRRSPTS